MLSTVLRLALFAWVFLLAPSSRAQQFEVVVQTGVRGRVQPVAFDPQGRFFVTEENDRFKLWDTRTLMELLSYPRNATDLGFALGGSRLIALLISKEERAIRVWNTETGEVALRFPATATRVRCSPAARGNGSPLYRAGTWSCTTPRAASRKSRSIHKGWISISPCRAWP